MTTAAASSAAMSQPSSSTATAATSTYVDARLRKPKRIYRYMEGFLTEEEREEHERAQAAAVAAAAATTAGEQGGASGTGKRAKIAKACLFCKRSHVSCEDQRPCSRCIMRGIGDKCCDSEQDINSAQRDSSPPSVFDTPQVAIASSSAQPMRDVEGIQPSQLSNVLDDTPGQTFDMLAFLGSMDAATAEWGPMPSHMSGASPHSAFGNPSWLVDMSNQTPPVDPATQRPPDRSARPVAENASPESISSLTASTAASRSAFASASKAVSESLDATSKPFVSGKLAQYSARPVVRPWQHMMAPDWSLTDNPEDSIVRPYQYAYGYTRIERWIHSPLSGWSDESAERVKAVLDSIRPLLRGRWAVLSDLQLVQHEERHDAIVAHYREHVCQAVPLPLFIIRRTCEIVCANDAFAKLCNCHPSVFTAGRLCLYQILEQEFMVAIFEKMADYLLRDAEAPIVLSGQVKFTCATAQQQDASVTNTKDVQLRQVCTRVLLSMDPVMDDYNLPLAFVCTLTPLD